MPNNLGRLKQASASRKRTDYPLVNWWLYALFLSWISLGIFPVVVFIERIQRRNRHFARMSELLSAAIECTWDASTAAGPNDYILEQISELKKRLSIASDGLLKPRGLSALFLPYAAYFLTVDWYELQSLEEEMLRAMTRVWLNIGLTNRPISASGSLPPRNYWAYLVLSLATLGIWAIYWDRCMHIDPEIVFDDTSHWEERVVEMFRRASLRGAI